VKYLIVDDEPIAHKIIEKYSLELPFLEKMGNCFNVVEALTRLRSTTVDLIFLDMQMPRLKGGDLLKSLASPPQVIVTSAHQEFAIEGYQYNVRDFLLKPFSFDRFLQAVNKVTPRENGASTDTPPNIGRYHRLFLKGDKKYHQVNLSAIQYIEAYGNYCKVHLDYGKLLIHQKISFFEQTLPKESFMRVHKSYIVALDQIDTVSGNQIQIHNTQIPIGQSYRTPMRHLMRLS